MDRLAHETLHNIVCHCDFATQKILRSVCRDLSSIAAENVFDTVYLALLSTSFNKVQKVAQHPTLSRHVKTLIFCPELLSVYGTLSEWKSEVNLRPYPRIECDTGSGDGFVDPEIMEGWIQSREFSEFNDYRFENLNGGKITVEEWIMLPRHQLSAIAAKQGFARHKAMNTQQQAFLTIGFTKVLRKLVRNLPNLVEAEITDPRGSRSLPLWRALHSDILQTPAPWSMEGVTFVRDWGVEHIASLLEATALEGRLLKRLTVDVDATSFLSSTDHFRSPAPARRLTDVSFEIMNGAFTQLRFLCMDFLCDREIPDELAAQRLVAFFRHATQLEQLILLLTPSMCIQHRGRGVDIMEHLKSTHLPKLKFLSLAGVRTSESNIITFLSAHAKTLKHLVLREANLNYSAGTWTSIVRQLPTLLSLEDISLGSLGQIRHQNAHCLHLGEFFHISDAKGPGSEVYSAAIEGWILWGHSDDEFPVLSAWEWEDIFPGEIEFDESDFEREGSDAGSDF